MHTRHKGSHHSQPQPQRNVFRVHSPNPQFRVGAPHQVHKRGSDDDRRQMIADLISDDASPFTPDDEESLRYMSDASLKEMRDQYVKRQTTSNRDLQQFINDEVSKALAPALAGLNKTIADAFKGNGYLTIEDRTRPIREDRTRSIQDVLRAKEEARLASLAELPGNEVAAKIEESRVENELRRQRANLYCMRNGARMPGAIRNREVTNSNDEAVRAMTTPSMVDFVRNRGK